MSRWRATPVVAWTEREGPVPPKQSGPWPWFATAGTLGIVFSVIFFTDTLCPEHRAWVQAFATVALVLSVGSIVGLLRSWSAAPFAATAAAALGVAIGGIDAAHSPARGGAVAGGFFLALVLGAYLSFRQVSLLSWDRRLHAESRFPSEPVVTDVAAAEPAPQPEQH